MPILQHLIDKYQHKTNHYVYRLSYAGKYVIVKGKTLAGSLYFIELGYGWFNGAVAKKQPLYLHFYQHIKANPGGRFRVKVLISTLNQYNLLKKEQQELNKARFDPLCLNNTTEAYIPLYSDVTESYGWMERSAVLNFKKWLKREVVSQ